MDFDFLKWVEIGLSLIKSIILLLILIVLVNTYYLLALIYRK